MEAEANAKNARTASNFFSEVTPACTYMCVCVCVCVFVRRCVRSYVNMSICQVCIFYFFFYKWLYMFICVCVCMVCTYNSVYMYFFFCVQSLLYVYNWRNEKLCYIVLAQFMHTHTQHCLAHSLIHIIHSRTLTLTHTPIIITTHTHTTTTRAQHTHNTHTHTHTSAAHIAIQQTQQTSDLKDMCVSSSTEIDLRLLFMMAG